MEERLTERLRALMAKATPGPFAVKEFRCANKSAAPANDGILYSISAPEANEHLAAMADATAAEANAALIVEAVNALPDLLALIEAQAERVRELEGALEALDRELLFDKPAGTATEAFARARAALDPKPQTETDHG